MVPRISAIWTEDPTAGPPLASGTRHVLSRQDMFCLEAQEMGHPVDIHVWVTQLTQNPLFFDILSHQIRCFNLRPKNWMGSIVVQFSWEGVAFAELRANRTVTENHFLHQVWRQFHWALDQNDRLPRKW